MKKMPCFLPALLFLYLQPWAQARTQMPMQTPHQSQPYQPVVDRIIRQQVVDSLAHSLLTNYIFRDTAARMGTYIRQRLKEGAYDKITDPNEFAQMLTADLHSVYKDLHMSIFYDPQFEKMLRDTSTSDQAAAAEENIRLAAHDNFAFKKVEILNSNVGYLMFEGFFDVNAESRATVNSAFAFLKNTDALIIDLRHNGGGDPEMVRFICSHLLLPKTHINDLFERRKDKTYPSVTDSSGDPANYYKMPIYILTSRRTFSGAEEFSYDLQTQHRARVIGETTGGGANPVGPETISNGFIGNIPWGRAINPVTHTNWEGVGVRPDVPAEADSALDVAMLTYFSDRIGRATDSNTVNSFIWARAMLLARMHPVHVDTALLKTLVGNFGKRTLLYKNSSLYYVNPIGLEIKLVPLSENTFKPAEDDRTKIGLGKDSRGQVIMMYVVHDDGSRVEYPRTP
jgi:hypothetical protein